MNKNRPDIKRELDVAMNCILEDNRDFNQHLTEKYNKACAVNSFLTHEEKNRIAEHGVIRLGYRDDFLPFCDSDKTLGGLTGALSDYLKFAETAEKNAQLSFETCAYPTMESALNALARDEIDCLFPVNLSSYDGEQRGVIITDPLVSTEMYAAVRTADRQGIYPDRQMTVAVLNGHISHEIFLQDHFPDWQLRYYNTVEECFQSVAAGETDCTLVSNYRINRVSALGDEIAAFMAESEGVVGRMEGDHFDIYCAHLDDYQALLDDIVAKYGLERRDLNLEVTESAYTENADYLIRMIGKLREMGYVIEMDDFGSGYSSLNMLSSMPIDVLKMDMAFIKNIERNERDFRLVELILDITRYLKVPVVAEGVETGNQLRLLKDAGCDLVQGYYFSRPLPAEEFEQKILDSAT